jgi:hypothetical protein
MADLLSTIIALWMMVYQLKKFRKMQQSANN